MKELKNYKNIRLKPTLFGFTFLSFMIFFFVLMISGLILAGIGYKNIFMDIILGIINIISFFVCKFVIGEQNVLSNIYNQKFPKEINQSNQNYNNG